jgi:hypothetical protein
MIRGVIKDGKISVPEPVDLPDGTVLTVHVVTDPDPDDESDEYVIVENQPQVEERP